MQSLNAGLDVLYAQARESLKTFEDVGQSIISHLKNVDDVLFDSAEFEVGPLKTKERAQAKIESDYGGDTTQISDLVRGRIVVKNADQIEALRNYINANGEELGIEKVKDQFAKPTDTGFRAINLKMRLPNGHVTELRVEHEGMVLAAKKTHDPYAQVQTIERQAEAEGRMLTEEEAIERQQLLDKVRDIHREPAQKDDLDSLLNQQGRQQLLRFDTERLSPPAAAQLSIPFDFSGPDATFIGAASMAAKASEAGVTIRPEFKQAGTNPKDHNRSTPKFNN